MFTNWRKKYIEKLERCIELEDTITELQKSSDKEYEIASQEVDFLAMNAFAVERIWSGNHYKTVIGYNNNGDIREWHIHCGIKQHEKLAEQFREYVKNKKVKK